MSNKSNRFQNKQKMVKDKIKKMQIPNQYQNLRKVSNNRKEKKKGKINFQ